MMKKINKLHTDILLSNLKNNIPFSFIRFNDGEMMGIKKVGAVVARGDQKVNESLRNKLIDAIQHRQENYYIGRPCSTCFPEHYKLYREYVEEDYEYEVLAVQFCNNNMWNYVIKEFNNILKGRDVQFVTGHDQVLKKLEFYKNIRGHYIVNSKNGWEDYKHTKPYGKSFLNGDVVLLSCGPMSRVLAYEWFKENPECTFIDVGSLFDPFTRNIWHNCHNGKLKYCKECNYDV